MTRDEIARVSRYANGADFSDVYDQTGILSAVAAFRSDLLALLSRLSVQLTDEQKELGSVGMKPSPTDGERAAAPMPADVAAWVDHLEERLAKAPQGPWLYRPRRSLDDWGMIRCEDADGPIVALSRACGDYDYDDCRRDGVDPYEDAGLLIVDAINGLPVLIRALRDVTTSEAPPPAPSVGEGLVPTEPNPSHPQELSSEARGEIGEAWDEHEEAIYQIVFGHTGASATSSERAASAVIRYLEALTGDRP
jgi:hypothetical protein